MLTFLTTAICVVGIIIQILFIVTERKEKYVPAVILKGTASLFFIALGVIGFVTGRSLLSLLILIGLVMGGIGDVCLNLRFVLRKSQAVFLGGIAAFLVGHLLYLCALITLADRAVLFMSVIGGLIAALCIILWIFASIEAKTVFKIFGVFYLGAVVLMTAVAIGIFASTMTPGSLIYMIGAILFTLSDIILIFNMFGSKKRAWMRPANLSLYYLGQLLIAISVSIIS